eukprot:3309838-Rhodomonas_salina.2
MLRVVCASNIALMRGERARVEVKPRRGRGASEKDRRGARETERAHENMPKRRKRMRKSAREAESTHGVEPNVALVVAAPGSTIRYLSTGHGVARAWTASTVRLVSTGHRVGQSDTDRRPKPYQVCLSSNSSISIRRLLVPPYAA